MSEAASLSDPPAQPSPLPLPEFLQARKQLGPGSVCPSASSPFDRERWDLVTDWLPFRDDCSTNPQPTRSRKPSDKDDKLCPGEGGGRGDGMIHEPLYPLVTFRELPSLGLKSSLRAIPGQAALRRKASWWLLAWVRGTQWGNDPGIFFWPNLLKRLVTLAAPGNKTVHFCSQGAWGLASWDPCAPPMPSPCPREKHSLVTLGKSHHFSAPQFSPLQNGNEENLPSLTISGIVNN